MSLDPIVRKQVYDVRVATRQSAGDAYQRIERVHRQSVVQVLNDVMREIGGVEELVLIERIELDLGRLSPDRLEEQLPERIGQLLRDKLARTDSATAGAAAADSSGRTVRAERADVEALEAFLLTGVMPWWAPAGGGSLPERLQRALDDSAQDFATMLRRRGGGTVTRRLARQFPQRSLRRVVALLAGPRRAAVEALVEDWLACIGALPPSTPGGGEARAAAVFAGALGALADSDGDAAALSPRIHAELLSVEPDVDGWERRLGVAAAGAVAAGSPVRQWIEGRARAGADASPTAPSPAAKRRVGSSPAPEALQRSATTETSRPAGRGAPDAAGEGAVAGAGPPATAEQGGPTPGSASKDHDTRPWRDAGEVTSTAGATADPASSPAPAIPQPRADGPPQPGPAFRVVDENVGLLVDNAGLVLLWPFLPRFFAEAGLLAEGVFASAAARERAVLLLHQAATGESETPEPSLVVNKLLCGLDLEAPVAGAFTPTEREAGEIAELHDSVLQAWSALGATSAAGLQGSFLQRQGVLSRQELGWNLKVERRGYDVLLDRLPWGIGLVMLPWMQEPLVVEW